MGTFRNTMQYQIRNSQGLSRGPADLVCLSYTHDRDYKELMPKKFQYHMPVLQDLDKHSNASTTTPAKTQKTWVRVCADGDLQEGGAKMLDLEKQNEQVVVFRHNGELFALDNRCAHMGGPLCEGDIEDLATHMAMKSSLRIRGGAQRTDGVVKCPRHGQCFNIRTGENIEGGHMKQRVYPVRLSSAKDIEVEVDLELDTGSASEADVEAATTRGAEAFPEAQSKHDDEQAQS